MLENKLFINNEFNFIDSQLKNSLLHTRARLHNLSHQAKPQKPQIRPHHLRSPPTHPHTQNTNQWLRKFQAKLEPTVPHHHHLHVRNSSHTQIGQMHAEKDEVAG